MRSAPAEGCCWGDPLFFGEFLQCFAADGARARQLAPRLLPRGRWPRSGVWFAVTRCSTRPRRAAVYHHFRPVLIFSSLTARLIAPRAQIGSGHIPADHQHRRQTLRRRLDPTAGRYRAGRVSTGFPKPLPVRDGCFRDQLAWVNQCPFILSLSNRSTMPAFLARAPAGPSLPPLSAERSREPPGHATISCFIRFLEGWWSCCIQTGQARIDHR